MTGTFKIKVGTVVQARNTSYRVEQILSTDELAVLNLDTLKTELLKVGELSLERKPTRRLHARPDVRKVSKEAWEKAEKQYAAVARLAASDSRTLEEVQKAAKALKVSVATIYRRLSSVQALDSPLAMLRRTKLEDEPLQLDLLSDGRSPTTLTEVVVYEARKKVKERIRCTGKKFCSDVIATCKVLNLDKPHPNSVRRLMNRLQPGVRIAILKGRKASLRLEAVGGEFADQKHPYHTFQIDHTMLDVMVVDSEKRRPIGRGWITVVIELYSRVVPGFFVSLDGPSIESVSGAIRHAILPKDNWLRERDLEMSWPIFGKPVVIHADNAKEFRGNVLRRVCRANTIDLNWRAVKKPRYGAHIERFMGTLAQILKDVKGATYSNPNEKIDYDSEGNAIMTLDELERWLAYRIGVIYHRAPHDGIGGQTPLMRLNNALVGTEDKPGIGLPPMVNDPHRLYRDFLPRFHHVIQPNGVTIQYVRYFDDALRAFVGEKDPDHPKRSRKWEFARDDRQISPIYFYNPRLDEYIDIPYADLSRPPISLWELKAAKKHLEESGGDPTDEGEIFRAHEMLRMIEQSSEKKTKAALRKEESDRRRKKTKQADDALPRKADAQTTAARERSQAEADRPPAEPVAKPRERRIFKIEELP